MLAIAALAPHLPTVVLTTKRRQVGFHIDHVHARSIVGEQINELMVAHK
jgi:hypothetical protein